MNRVISPKFALATIVFIFFVMTVAIWIASQSIETNNLAAQPPSAKNKSGSCTPRAFQGEAKVRVWQAKDDKKIVEVANEDVDRLPIAKNKISIIDSTPVLQERLSAASEEQPETVTLTGFATTCGDLAYASLNYKDGIFRQYIVKK